MKIGEWAQQSEFHSRIRTPVLIQASRYPGCACGMCQVESADDGDNGLGLT